MNPLKFAQAHIRAKLASSGATNTAQIIKAVIVGKTIQCTNPACKGKVMRKRNKFFTHRCGAQIPRAAVPALL